MFILTAKLNKKKLAAISIVIIVAIIVLVAILTVVRNGKSSGSAQNEIRSASDAVSYLSSLGWEVSPEPLDTQEIVIPREFSGVYKNYIALQNSQGFDLEKYGGMRATRYSFKVLNYPGGGDDIVADLIVCNTQVIAGDIQSTALNGFMVGIIGGTTVSAAPSASAVPSASPTDEVSPSPQLT